MGRKHCGKRRNCLLPAISPFPTVFSKDLYYRHVKTRACLGEVVNTIHSWKQRECSIILLISEEICVVETCDDDDDDFNIEESCLNETDNLGIEMSEKTVEDSADVCHTEKITVESGKRQKIS